MCLRRLDCLLQMSCGIRLPLNESRPVIRVHATYLIDTYKRLEQVTNLPASPATVGDIQHILFGVNIDLLGLYGGSSIYKDYLRISYNIANKLFACIDKIVNNTNKDEIVSESHLRDIQVDYNELRTILHAEIQSMHLYLITPKDP